MKTLNEPPLLSFTIMYEEKYITLFELDGHDKYPFFGLISKDGNRNYFSVPLNDTKVFLMPGQYFSITID